MGRDLSELSPGARTQSRIPEDQTTFCSGGLHRFILLRADEPRSSGTAADQIDMALDYLVFFTQWRPHRLRKIRTVASNVAKYETQNITYGPTNSSRGNTFSHDMKCVGLNEAAVPHRKRHSRASRKKRLRLKKRASLEHTVEKVDGNQHDADIVQPSQTQEPVQTEVQVLIRQEDADQPQRQQQPQQDDALSYPEPQHQRQFQQEEQDRSVGGTQTQVDAQGDMTEYERKRRATVLRNQAFMQTIGISIAKMAARTSIGNEAAKEARRQELAAKRAENALRKAELLNQPLRKSRRLINEERDRVARETFRRKWEMKKQTHNGRTREVEGVTAKPSAPLQQVEPPRRKDPALVQVAEHQGKSAVGYLHRPRGASGDTKEEMDRKRSRNDVLHAQIFAQKTASNHNRPGYSLFNKRALKDMMRPEVGVNRLTAGRAALQSQPARSIPTAESENDGIRLTQPTLPATRSHTSSENPSVPSQTRPKSWMQSSTGQYGNKSAIGEDGGKLRGQKDAEQQEARTVHSARPDQAHAVEYERTRRENTLRNQAFVQQAGASSAKLAARTLIGHEAEKAAKEKALAATRAENAARLASLLPQPKRRSARLTLAKEQVVVHSTELGHPLDILDLTAMRQPYGSKLYVMDAADSEGEAFCKEIGGGGIDLENGVAVADEMVYSLSCSDVVKPLNHRVTTMTFHPRADRVIVASGDKEGHVALWSPAHGARKSVAALSRPHGFPVTKLVFPDAYTLASSSIDGTVREFDLGAGKSSLVCDLSDEIGITSLIGSGSPQFYYASCEDGSLRLVDRRAQSVLGAAYALHKKRMNSVDQHPRLDL